MIEFISLYTVGALISNISVNAYYEYHSESRYGQPTDAMNIIMATILWPIVFCVLLLWGTLQLPTYFGKKIGFYFKKRKEEYRKTKSKLGR